MSNAQFTYDVFRSHSAKDKDVVRAIAQRLKNDGLQVWFDEWSIKPGSSVPARIEEGLEHSRVLVLCTSAHAFGSEWAQLEADTFRFRDPLNMTPKFQSKPQRARRTLYGRTSSRILSGSRMDYPSLPI